VSLDPAKFCLGSVPSTFLEQFEQRFDQFAVRYRLTFAVLPAVSPPAVVPLGYGVQDVLAVNLDRYCRVRAYCFQATRQCDQFHLVVGDRSGLSAGFVVLRIDEPTPSARSGITQRASVGCNHEFCHVLYGAERARRGIRV